MILITHNNDQHGIITLRVSVVVFMYLDGNQQYSLILKRDIMPGHGNLARHPELVISWFLEENLQLPLY